ncbi:MAG: histidine phosphatase family protein [Armatimonadota bacterium]|nr:histidine phosphatase family protein [Armatimonadota bacterium]
MDLIFVRHGQTVWNAEDRMQGQSDTELSELGLRQAKQVARVLAGEDISAFYSSDLQRASVTAEIIAEEHKLPVVKTPLLREVNLGFWQGLNTTEIQEQYPNEYAAYRTDSVLNRPPGAERIESVIDRARRFIEMVTAREAAGRIVVVAHGGIIRGALCWSLDAGPELYRRVRLENAGITTIRTNASGCPSLVLAVNDTCHLRSMNDSENIEEM